MLQGPRTLLVWHMLPTDMHHQRISSLYTVRSSEGSDAVFEQQHIYLWQVRIVTTRSCLEPSVLHSNAILVATRDRAGPTPPADQPKFAWLYLPALPCWRVAIRDASSSR